MIYQALKIRSKKETNDEKIDDNQNQDWMSTFHQKSNTTDTSSPKTTRNEFKQMFSDRGGNKVFNEIEIPNKDILNKANNKITLNEKNSNSISYENYSEDSEYDFLGVKMYYVGVDEAGRGPMIGPLVVTAIAIPEDDIQLLEEHKITDSKKVTKKNREMSFELIEKYSKERNWKIHTTICDAIEIDLAMETSNLNILETELFAKSINLLNLNSEGKGEIILDACDIDEKDLGIEFQKNP